jgi:outer membrane immunogenic protein
MYVPVVPLYNWTGFYLGGNLGFGLTGGSFNSSIPGTSVS